MAVVRTNLRKLKRLSFVEFRVRSWQSLNAFAERRGWSSLVNIPDDKTLLALLDRARMGSDLSSAPELLEYFHARKEPKFFTGFADREATAQEFRIRWPSAEPSIVEQANRILAGRFDLLGYRNQSFGEPIDWHLEPISGKRTPLVHWSKLDYLDAELAGDKKMIWELNRHQYFATLGRAYWLTNDERYAQTVVTHLESWMDQNPPKLGINWASSLEVAFRSISWLWALYFLKDSPSLSSNTFIRALKFLYLNARHLETYLSSYFSPNTHLTGEALGLFYLGTVLPEFKEAARWRETGRQILLDQLLLHVRPDGVYFEQSSYYHRYTADFYTHFLILSHANGEVVPSQVEDKLRALLDHLMFITRPDGTTPFFGDDDGGRLVMLDQRAANDFRAVLSTGAVLFERSDYKFVAGDRAEETLWLMGPEGIAKLDALEAREPTKQSVAFPDSGYHVMRDGWTAKSNYLLFDCGPHGTLNCGHAHADALSFDLAAQGQTLLVDPGTYTYTGSKEMRDWFRSSAAHNTLTIDGESSSAAAGPFSWKSIAVCERLKWISSTRFDYVQGRHDGYLRLPDPADHARSILFLKKDYWIMRDQVKASGEHSADLWFHFDSDATPLIETYDGQVVAIAERDREHDSKGGLDIFAFAADGQWRREEGWVSHCYGERAPAPVYAFSALTKGDAELLTFLLPQFGSQASRRRVREVEAIGGRAFEVTHENGLDVVMIRTGHEGQRVEMARLASDFEWTWARLPHNGGQLPEEFVLIDGQSLELEGREILKSEGRINYLAASRLGDVFRVETEDGTLDLSLPISDLESLFADSNRQSAI